MPIPKDKLVRTFYFSALQRFEDGQYLHKGERHTAAVYLAGYSVECMMKALLLTFIPKSRRSHELKLFRGGKAHDFDWLRQRYLKRKGPPFPPEIARQFSRVNSWTSDMRYDPGTMDEREAKSFLEAVDAILYWIKERL